jgi:hypothetical protein
MTISNNFFSRRIARLLRLTSALILAGCALWMGHRVPVNYARTGAPANPPPNLRGHAAVEHLKQEGLYNTQPLNISSKRGFTTRSPRRRRRRDTMRPLWPLARVLRANRRTS